MYPLKNKIRSALTVLLDTDGAGDNQRGTHLTLLGRAIGKHEGGRLEDRAHDDHSKRERSELGSKFVNTARRRYSLMRRFSGAEERGGEGWGCGSHCL